MTEVQYNELLKAYGKEALANMIKTDIRLRFPEPYASKVCIANSLIISRMLPISLNLQRR